MTHGKRGSRHSSWTAQDHPRRRIYRARGVICPYPTQTFPRSRAGEGARPHRMMETDPVPQTNPPADRNLTQHQPGQHPRRPRVPMPMGRRTPPRSTRRSPPRPRRPQESHTMTAPTLTRRSLSPKPYGPNPPCLYLDCTYEGPRSELGLCPTHDQATHLHGGQRNGPMKYLAETERLERFYKIATLKKPRNTRGRLPNNTDRLPKDHYLRTHTITITQDEHDTAHEILDQMDHAQRSRLLTVEHLPKHLSGRGIAKNPGFIYTVCQAVLLNRYTIKEN